MPQFLKSTWSSEYRPSRVVQHSRLPFLGLHLSVTGTHKGIPGGLSRKHRAAERISPNRRGPPGQYDTRDKITSISQRCFYNDIEPLQHGAPKTQQVGRSASRGSLQAPENTRAFGPSASIGQLRFPVPPVPRVATFHMPSAAVLGSEVAKPWCAVDTPLKRSLPALMTFSHLVRSLRLGNCPMLLRMASKSRRTCWVSASCRARFTT
mmetsp:Transcript_48582/g.112590  ORF Transcript_48582/g.112590 Transcript_48582/m.112590 type:complete len:208 (-) Transcript_48582:1153-1776(-)